MFCNLSTVIKMLLLNAHKLSGTFIFQEQNSVLAHMSGSVGFLHRLSLIKMQICGRQFFYKYDMGSLSARRWPTL